MNSNKPFTTSYVDDFQIMVASNPWERNARRLEHKAAEMVAIAHSLGLGFSRAKTEPMHWWKKRKGGPHSEASVTIQAHVVKPAGTVVR